MTTPSPTSRPSESSPVELVNSSFESEIAGRPVARLAIAPDATHLALDARTERWRREGVWLVSCRLDESQAAAFDAELVGAGFVAVEILETFEGPLAIRGPGDTEPARPGDIAACVAIARAAFRSDRFHADTRLPRTFADEVKAQWVRNDLEGRTTVNLVARDAAGAVAGFALCAGAGDAAVIDLIAVAPTQQGRGFGRRLLGGIAGAFAGRATRVRAGTQVANLASGRLYRGAGMRVVSRAHTYHWVAA